MGTDFVFGTEIREDVRAHNSLPVAIEFRTITHSDGKLLGHIISSNDDFIDEHPSGSTSTETASNKANVSHSATTEKLGNGSQPQGLKADVMNIC